MKVQVGHTALFVWEAGEPVAEAARVDTGGGAGDDAEHLMAEVYLALCLIRDTDGADYYLDAPAPASGAHLAGTFSLYFGKAGGLRIRSAGTVTIEVTGDGVTTP